MKRMKMAVLLTVFGLAMFAAMPAKGAIINVDFEDLPITSYGCCGMIFTSGGVDFITDQFQDEYGTWTPNGSVDIIVPFDCGSDRRTHFSGNANTRFDLAGMPLKRLKLEFGEHGGNLNVEVNGIFKNINQMMALDNYTWGAGTGPVSHVTLTGGDCGIFKVEGEITTFSIGGQELEVDNIEMETQQCFLGVVMQ